VRTGLGDVEALITISPATAGMNTLTLRLRDAAGEPAEGTEPPRLTGDLSLVTRTDGISPRGSVGSRHN
jgi:hypothetical protein